MTDSEIISAVFSCIDPSAACIRLVRRNGRALLVLPGHQEAAARALDLYQPQRVAARLMTCGLGLSIRMGLGVPFLPPMKPVLHASGCLPDWGTAEPGTCGILLGSPEHRIRRAIASYRHAGNWEVAKISFGLDGAQALEQEARALQELQAKADGVPRLLGLHHGVDVTVLRMPYLTGEPLVPDESIDALQLLTGWISTGAEKPITEFPEWPAIEPALSEMVKGSRALNRLACETLRPAICHGDFARWNLRRRPDGGLVVLDWEWGHDGGIPGIDLVHYFLQDMRLVRRLAPQRAIDATVQELNRAECSDYLRQTGWSGDPMLPVLACLAYKQGAEHQDNLDMLATALAMMTEARRA